MKHTLTTLLLTAAAVMLAGCATHAAPPAAANYGECPPASRYEAVINEFLRRALVYPTSAQITFGEPYKGQYTIAGPDAGENAGTHYGYMIPVTVNHKNGYGKYEGVKQWQFFFQDWKLVAYYNGDGRYWLTLADPKRLPLNP